MIASRNLWPYGVIAAFALFLSGTAGLIVLAVSHRTDLVSDHYYEDEIRFQSQMDRAGRAQTLNSNAVVNYDPAGKRILVSLPAEHAGRATEAAVMLYRPSAAGLDRRIAWQPGPDGVQAIDAAELKAGLWKISVGWTVDGQEYLFDQKIVVGGGKR